MEHLNGPVILSVFLMSSVVYWHVYFLVDYLLHKYAPTVHGRLKREDEIRKLMPLVITLVRMAFGLVVTLPSCIQAARTTPWGVDQPLNNAGKVCVVSQLAVWSNELPQARFYSMELFVHHILCLVAAANIILSPPIHQIKPLYIYFGSLCAFYTLTHVLTDPYNLADWIIRVDPVRYKVTCFCQFAVPISHSLLAVACSATLLSSLFLYGIYLGRPLRPGETHRLSLHGLVAVALGMTGALIARLAYPHNASRSDPWGRFLARVAQYYAAKDVEAVRDAKLSPGNSVIRRHVEIALEHAVIFIILLGILIINLLSLPEAARLSIAACLVVQLRYRWNIVPLAAANTHGLAGVLLAIVLIVLEPGFIAFATTGRFIRLESSWSAIFHNYLLLGGTVMAAISVPRSEPASRPCETVKEPCRSKRFHPTTILFVFFCILQAMLIAKYMTFDGKTPEICPGFVNFRSIFSDIYTWVGALHMASLPVVVLRELE
ncbi:hypothetical protein FOC1_g10011311 [Fusarium oxysporum f. sp. cubense race 1]|uniref:Uncharacterized protein n=1 Tax=Fusarium oxysporum f. sp. cubense (strain race 1) TaxID=1229664 RepID=N4UDW8_FUSC1|nr:hypothetical protein FOC1_g10011311 [Fusarium oxysporum f. sp. cubense race 1]